jgi:hypothetical protein
VLLRNPARRRVVPGRSGRVRRVWCALHGAFLLCLAMAICGGANATEASASSAALTSESNYYVTWVAVPDPIPLNEMFELRFRVASASDHDRLVRGAVVTASAWMPLHNHGMSLQPQIESHGDGTATGHGFLLHMPGVWELRVAVMVDGQMERATFRIDLEP